MPGGLVSTPKDCEILVRAGGAEPLRIGTPWRRRRFDSREVEAVTLARADASLCATLVGADGAVRTASANKLRLSYAYDSVAVTWGNAGFLLESSRTNLVLQSENFGTTWSAVGTPTRSAGAATCGALSLDLIGDDAAGALEGYAQTVVFTGNAVKAVSVFIAQGSSTSSVIYLEDASAAATRLLAVVTWLAGVPVVTMSTGTLLRSVRCASGVYRLEFQTATVTAANTNNLWVLPATNAALAVANTGTLYAGGVQAENSLYPSSYIKTTTATVTRAADALTYPIGFPPCDLTVYAKVIRPAWAGLDVTGAAVLPYLFSLGTESPTDSLLTVTGGIVAGQITAQAFSGGGGSESRTSAAPGAGDFTIAVNAINFATSVDVRMDLGSGFGSTVTTATLPGTKWDSNVARVGRLSAGAEADAVIVDLIVARGSFTMAELQAAV
jgi:hypothetical protein